MNKKHLFLFITISLVVAVISYIVLENIFVSLGILALYLLISVLILIPLLKKYDSTMMKYHECYHFENNFIISQRKSIVCSFTLKSQTTMIAM